MKSKKSFLITGILFLAFAAYTVMISRIDVQSIGPEQSEIGMATLNRFVFEHIGVNLLWYDITNYLGMLAILVACGFALCGFVQLLKYKSLLKIDDHILLLGVFYMIVAAWYVFFEHVVINYRPILLQAELEASYPSSHTMLVICIMTTAIFEFRRLFFGRNALRVFLEVVSFLIMTITVIGRMLSGVHWFTDIVGGILLSSALVMFYRSVVILVTQKRITN